MGLDRLVEALECTMWSNMIQKTQQIHMDGVPKFSSGHLPSEALESAQIKKAKSDFYMPEAARIDSEVIDGDQAELQVESLVNLMQEMKRVQETNKNQTSLTDEQRRKNAEEMMLKFSKIMGIGEDEDDFE